MVDYSTNYAKSAYSFWLGDKLKSGLSTTVYDLHDWAKLKARCLGFLYGAERIKLHICMCLKIANLDNRAKIRCKVLIN